MGCDARVTNLSSGVNEIFKSPPFHFITQFVKIPEVTTAVLESKSEVVEKVDETDAEDYEKLLEDLDKQTDEDIIEKVLKRYGLK